MADREPTEAEVQADIDKLSDAEFLNLNIINIKEDAKRWPSLNAIVRRFEKIRDRLQRLDGTNPLRGPEP